MNNITKIKLGAYTQNYVFTKNCKLLKVGAMLLGLVFMFMFNLSVQAGQNSSIKIKQNMATIPGVMQQAKTGLSIIGLEIARVDPTSCQYQWIAKIRNYDHTQLDDIIIQGHQLGGSDTFSSASGHMISVPARGVTLSGSNLGKFTRGSAKTDLKVELLKSGVTLARKTISLPPEQMHVALVNYQPTATEYKISVKNLSANGFPGLIIQTYTGPSAEGPWSPAGGTFITTPQPQGFACLTGGRIYVRQGTKPAGHSHLKVQLKIGQTIVKEKIFGTVSRGRGRRQIKQLRNIIN